MDTRLCAYIIYNSCSSLFLSLFFFSIFLYIYFCRVSCMVASGEEIGASAVVCLGYPLKVFYINIYLFVCNVFSLSLSFFFFFFFRFVFYIQSHVLVFFSYIHFRMNLTVADNKCLNCLCACLILCIIQLYSFHNCFPNQHLLCTFIFKI